MRELTRAVAIIIEHCLGVRPGEDALVIADAGTRVIGEALRGAAAERGSDAVLAIMDERGTDGTEPPASIAAALAACDLYIAPTTHPSATQWRANGPPMPACAARRCPA